MLNLEKNQKRQVFLGRKVTNEMKISKKGTVDVKILQIFQKTKIVKVLILRSNQKLNINVSGILPYTNKQKRENKVNNGRFIDIIV